MDYIPNGLERFERLDLELLSDRATVLGDCDIRGREARTTTQLIHRDNDG
jgi:hypothetical protein